MIKFFKMALLFLSIAHSEISFQAIKGIHTVQVEKGEKKLILKAGYDHLSPIWGFLALKTGMIENLRFFGNYEFGWDKENQFKRDYASDKGQDGITKLVRILFPSTGGQLATFSTSDQNLGQYITSSIIAQMLNGIQELREGKNTKFNIELNADYKTINKNFSGFELKGKEKKDKFQDGLTKLFQGCLQNEEKGLYPKHTTEHIVLAFFWSQFNSKNDIKEMYKNLDKRYIDEVVEKGIEENDLLKWDDIKKEEKTTDLSNKNLEETIQIVYGVDYFKNPTPYVLGESLISNGETHYYDRSKLGKEGEIKDKKGYADCVEVSQRHLFNFVLFNQDGQKFNLENLEKNIKEKIKNWNPNSSFLNMKEWFYGEQQPTKDKANAGDIQTRSAWNSVMGDLNHNCGLCQDLKDEKEQNFYKVHYCRKINDKENRNELDTGFINFLNVIEHVLGVRLEDLGTDDEKQNIQKWAGTLINEDPNIKMTKEYKEAYEKYVTIKMQIFLNIAKNEYYTFNIEDFNFGDNKKGQHASGHPYDLFFPGSIMNEMKIKGQKEQIKDQKEQIKDFTFVIQSSDGHGETKFHSKKEEKNFTISENFKNTLLDAYLKQSATPFYKLYAKNLFSDCYQIGEFLKDFLKSDFYNKEANLSLLQSTVAQLGLDDEEAMYIHNDLIHRVITKEFLKYHKNLFQHTEYVSEKFIRILLDIHNINDASIFHKVLGTLSIKQDDFITSFPQQLEKLDIIFLKNQEMIFPETLKKLNLIHSSITLKNSEKLKLEELEVIQSTLTHWPKNIQTVKLEMVSPIDLSDIDIENLEIASGEFDKFTLPKSLKSLKIINSRLAKKEPRKEFQCPYMDGLTELSINNIKMHNIPKSVKIIKMLNSDININENEEPKRILDLDDLEIKFSDLSILKHIKSLKRILIVGQDEVYDLSEIQDLKDIEIKKVNLIFKKTDGLKITLEDKILFENNDLTKKGKKRYKLECKDDICALSKLD